MIPYSIRGASEETGIHPSSLRRWEAMGLIAPDWIEMGAGRMRIYSEAELGLLKEVKRLMNEGFGLRAAIERMREGGGIVKCPPAEPGA